MISEWLARLSELRQHHRRRRAGRPPTDHRVVIHDVRPAGADDDFVPYLAAICSEPGCGWLELADPGHVGAAEEEQLRARAAKHTSTIAPGTMRPLG